MQMNVLCTTSSRRGGSLSSRLEPIVMNILFFKKQKRKRPPLHKGHKGTGSKYDYMAMPWPREVSDKKKVRRLRMMATEEVRHKISL